MEKGTVSVGLDDCEGFWGKAQGSILLETVGSLKWKERKKDLARRVGRISRL